MSERKVSFAHGEFYHLYNRGNSKQVIFKDGGDYQRFQQMLFAMNAVEGVTFRLIEREKMYKYDRGDLLVAIGAYCLMPNHFHILLTPFPIQGRTLYGYYIHTRSGLRIVRAITTNVHSPAHV